MSEDIRNVDDDFDFTFTQEEFDQTLRDAERGDLRACNAIGNFWLSPDIRINPVHVQMLRKAAEEGSMLAQYELAGCLASEYWSENDWAEVVHWYRKAADNGCVDALYLLACYYYHGKGVPADKGRADSLCRLAAEKGCVSAQFQLAENLFDADRDEALAWYRKASDAGHENASYVLARCYEEGDGVVQDLDEAIKYAEKVVATGGHFIERELMRDAVRVLVRCMKRGNVRAQIVLGDLYADEYSLFAPLGCGLPWMKRLKAAHCYRKAAAQGSEVAADKLRKILEGKDEIRGHE